MLTSTQIALVQRRFAIIAPIADDAAALFYQRLFELDPSLRRMFPEDMTGQPPARCSNRSAAMASRSAQRDYRDRRADAAGRRRSYRRGRRAVGRFGGFVMLLLLALSASDDS
jgi:hypothetical protein